MLAVGRFAELSGPELGRLAPGAVVVQPVGAIEHHGPHLPLATDAIVAEAVADAAALARADLSLLVLPVLSYALSSEHLWAPGTVSLSPTTLLGVLDDLGASLARAGVARLVFLNGHGGNSALLRVACREIRVRHGLLTFLAHPNLPVDQGGTASKGDTSLSVHAGAGETSVLAYLRPDLVHLDRAERCLPEWLAGYEQVGFGKEVTFGWTSEDLSPLGVIGDPTLASPEAGRELFERSTERFADALGEIARFSFPDGPASPGHPGLAAGGTIDKGIERPCV